MGDIMSTIPSFVRQPAVTRAAQAELLKHLAINWPAPLTLFPADIVRSALLAGAVMLDGTAPKRKPFDILEEDFGLKLVRFASDRQVRVIGVRTSGGGISGASGRSASSARPVRRASRRTTSR